MDRLVRVFNQVTSYCVRICYGLTICYVLVVLAHGVQESVGQLDPALQRRDRYTTSPGFDPVEQKQAMARTQEFFADHPDKQ